MIFGDGDEGDKKPAKAKQKLAVTELGFPVDVRAREHVLRGNYDATRIQRDHPQLVDLITWLLSLPGMTYEAIAEAAGISWETVSGIAALKKEPIREFKLRAEKKLRLVLEAALGGLMAKAARGEFSALDFKLLTDAWLQFSGEGQTVRFETGQENPERARFRRFLEQSGAVPGGAGMVREVQEISAMGPPPALPSGEGKIPLNSGSGVCESPVYDSQSVEPEQTLKVLDVSLVGEAADDRAATMKGTNFETGGGGG